MTEKWLPVVGFETLYEVSNLGRVRSLDRTWLRNGFPVRWPGRELKGWNDGNGYRHVSLTVDGNDHSRAVHHLVLEAFVGARPPGMLGLHWDDDPQNNALENLRWGTRQQNGHDRTRNGKDRNANKSECVNGHEFTPENTLKHGRKGGRKCRKCVNKRRRERAVRLREAAA